MKNANPPAKKINIAISSLETELPMDEINYQADKRIGRGGIDAILVIEKDRRLAMHAKNSGSLMPFFFRRGSTSATRLYHTWLAQLISASVSKTAYRGSNPQLNCNLS